MPRANRRPGYVERNDKSLPKSAFKKAMEAEAGEVKKPEGPPLAYVRQEREEKQAKREEARREERAAFAMEEMKKNKERVEEKNRFRLRPRGK